MRPIKTSPKDLIATDFVQRGRLCIAAVDDKTRVVNVVMSLFGNQGYLPTASQLLFCSASTSWEDLSLLLLRCFYADHNGRPNTLFCIANIEQLEFNVQYKLVNGVRELMEKYPNFMLALVCCKDQSQHRITFKL